MRFFDGGVKESGCRYLLKVEGQLVVWTSIDCMANGEQGCCW